jgi:hypothetical protein
LPKIGKTVLEKEEAERLSKGGGPLDLLICIDQ